MLRILKIPKIQMAIALFLILITAFIQQPSISLLFRTAFIILLAMGIDFILLKIRKIGPFFLSAGLVSGLIISLLLAPNLPIIESVSAVLFAILSKHFLRIDKKHIFNPAGFGLFFAGLVFAHDISWWATSFQRLNLSFLILLLPGYISVIKMKRFRIVIAFLTTYVILNLILSQNFTLLDPTVIFFSLVMLPEPMTTPNKPAAQILFGIFVATLSILISLPASNFQPLISRLIPDPLIAALLIGNLGSRLIRN